MASAADTGYSTHIVLWHWWRSIWPCGWLQWRSMWPHGCKDGGLTTLRPRQNGRHFSDDTFRCFFLNENVSISIEISLKFVPKGLVSSIPALVQIMAWRHPGDKPLSEPMMVRLQTHICITRPKWVNTLMPKQNGPPFPRNFLNAFFSGEVWLKFQWHLFLRIQLIVNQYWFRWWIGTTYATRHYLNQWWPCTMSCHGGSMCEHVQSLHIGAKSDQNLYYLILPAHCLS